MQTSDRQHFEPLPNDIQSRLDAIEPRTLTREVAKAIAQEAPRPVLFVGEIVRFNDMNFRVTRIKADGKVGLKMVP